MFLLLKNGRLQTVNNRPTVGAWVDIVIIINAVAENDNDSVLFEEFESKQEAIDALSDGEYLESIGCDDSHQEAIESIVAHLGGE